MSGATRKGAKQLGVHFFWGSTEDSIKQKRAQGCAKTKETLNCGDFLQRFVLSEEKRLLKRNEKRNMKVPAKGVST